MGMFDKCNYIVNNGITEQVVQCSAKVILLAKDDWTVDKKMGTFVISNYIINTGIIT